MTSWSSTRRPLLGMLSLNVDRLIQKDQLVKRRMILQYKWSQIVWGDTKQERRRDNETAYCISTMEEKERYTLKELYDNLEIGLSELGRRSKVSEVTVARIRNGYSARRSTINRLLRAFSEEYKIKLSIENVTGIRLEDRSVIVEQGTVPPTSSRMPSTIPQSESSQSRSTERKKEDIPDDLPEGTIRLIDFIEKYGLPESSTSRWVNTGVKKGEKLPTTTRPKVSGMGVQHFLTPDQQDQALEILYRHGKLKPSEEKKSEDETPAA